MNIGCICFSYCLHCVCLQVGNIFIECSTPQKINQVRNHPNAIEVGLIYDVPKYLQEGCCLVSLFAKPHFSLPVIEAFASHEPLIVIDIAGTSDVVKHGLNGLVVKKNNPTELANAINFMRNNGNRAQEMGVNGYKDALENIAHQI